MERLEPDLWSLRADSSSITSFFALPLTDGHSPSIGKGFLSTGTCGLGWRFVFSAKNADYHQEIWDKAVALRKTIFNVFFAPHLITMTDLGALSVTITVGNLTQTADGSTTISLPTSLQRIPLASYISDKDFTGIATVTIKVEFQSSFTLSRFNEPPTYKVQQALCRSLAGDALGDTKFCLFTRRTAQRQVIQPRVIFANSSLLQGHSAYLDNLMVSDEAMTTGAELANITHGVMYDYDSDSDLDPDSDEADLDTDDQNGARATAHGEKAFNDTPELGANEHAIFIHDIAFRTWKSLVFYLYTREVNFKGLTSRTPRPSRKFDKSLPSSPKSMYRIADKIDLPELKLLALDAIARDLSEGNIVTEVFSRFTSRYPEVQKVEVGFLMKVLTPTVFEDLMQKMKNVVAGNLPHCFDVVAAVMREMNMHGVGDEGRHTLPAAVPLSRPGTPVSREEHICGRAGEAFREDAPTPAPADTPPQAKAASVARKSGKNSKFMREMSMHGVGDEGRHSPPAAVLPSLPGTPVIREEYIWGRAEDPFGEDALTLTIPDTSLQAASVARKSGKNSKLREFF